MRTRIIQDIQGIMIAFAYLYYATFSAWAGVHGVGLPNGKTSRWTQRRSYAHDEKNSSVTKREETTRSHPEHGRKDS